MAKLNSLDHGEVRLWEDSKARTAIISAKGFLNDLPRRWHEGEAMHQCA